MNPTNTLGPMVKDARLAAGMTRPQVCKLTGYSHQYLYELENCQARMPAERVDGIALAVGLPVEQLRLAWVMDYLSRMPFVTITQVEQEPDQLPAIWLQVKGDDDAG